MDESKEILPEIVHLTRLALAGRRQDVQMFARRLARKLSKISPEVAEQLDELLSQSPTREAPLRNDAVSAVPVDTDSRLQLLRSEYPVALEIDPIWEEAVSAQLQQLVDERGREAELHRAGLHPSKSALFTGEPGVGKSLAARWVAARLNRPLLTLDLSAVMSSFLGRTGTNVRHVLDYAKGIECVLFLDELDAVAKRRDDETEIGELKRLVTVLLQEIDDWPSSGILLAATNHSDLLDPAVWRRFDMVVEFPMPSAAQVAQAVNQLVSEVVSPRVRNALVAAMRGMSFSDIARDLNRVRRQSITSGRGFDECALSLVKDRAAALSLKDRKALAASLVEGGLSRRQVEPIAGVHRQTISKAMAARDSDGAEIEEGSHP